MRWLSVAVLAGAAVVLASSWDHLPDVWVIHWGIGDRPDGWARKSVIGVFGPLLFGVVLLALIEGLSRLSAKRHPAITGAVRDFIGCVDLGLAIMMAGLALWLPLARPRSSLPIVLFALGVVVASIAMGSIRFGRAMRALKAEGVPGLEGYHGAYYKNAKDERLWVPKITGPGWTLNFAHPWAWPVMVLMLIPVLIAIGLSIAATVAR